MGFSKLAAVYDRFNDQEAYQTWLAFTLRHIAEPGFSLLDLGTGTGYLPVHLEALVEGQFTAIDLDEAMLEVARSTYPESRVSFEVGDMTALPYSASSFDLVTSYLDAICFLEDKQEVEAAFKEAFRILKDGGLFLFDVWTLAQMEAFDGFMYFDQDEEASLLWRSEVESSMDAVTHHLTVYEREEGNLYRRQEARLHEHTYPLLTYIDLLQRAGFQEEDLHVYIEEGRILYEAWDEEVATDRWFISAKKRVQPCQ